MQPSRHPRIRRGCPGGDRTPLFTGPARPCAFLDRDGVINRDFGYVNRRADFLWVQGAREAVQALEQKGWWRVVVTNQSGISRGYYTEEDFHSLSEWLLGQLSLDLILYCPHENDCPARKPGHGMIQAAQEALPIDLSSSFLIGDKAADMGAAQGAGIKGIRFDETVCSVDEALRRGGIDL